VNIEFIAADDRGICRSREIEQLSNNLGLEHLGDCISIRKLWIFVFLRREDA